MCDLEGGAHILFNQQHGELLLLAQSCEYFHDLADNLRCQANGRFVEHDRRWISHQPSPNCQHLLLAAGESSGRLPHPGLQTGEKIEHGIDIAFAIL